MNASRRRKIAYLITIVVLFTLIVQLSPWLERSADRHRLSQRSLGNVNPVSGTAQLVCLGFRGVAVTLLWQQANELKEKERWYEIEPVLESIMLLQPNFVTPWQFQAWNMAYNITAEWEGVADKYYWIRRGILFMHQACKANEGLPDLPWYVGWMYYNRFSLADEAAFLRQLFREEGEETRGEGRYVRTRSGLIDPFESSYDWHVSANAIVLEQHKPPKGRGMTPFLSMQPRSKIELADVRAREGHFGERTRIAWEDAFREWREFGLGYNQGDVGRYAFIPRLEFTAEEYDKLTDEEKYWCKRYGDIVRYPYWKKRAELERTREMLEARELLHRAETALKSGDRLAAVEWYDKAFPIWRKILEANEVLRTDDEFRNLLEEHEKKYRTIYALNQGSKRFQPPERWPLDGIFEPTVEE